MNEQLRSTLLHLRFPFSFFLLPIYFAALASVRIETGKAAAVFAIFHLFLYPASNGFNSYFDRDAGPIGGLASPPPVNRSLLLAALGLDAVALVWAFALGPACGIAALVYGTASKLYSWDRVRIKRLPVAGWLMTGLGQGAFTFMAMALVSSGGGLAGLGSLAYSGSLLITLFLLGVYPLTQIYQHEEDAKRGDLTVSRLLGIRGTLLLAAAFLVAATAGFCAWMAALGGPAWAAAFLAAQLPALLYFIRWTVRVFRDEGAADHRSTMRMNLIASSFMSLFFVLFLVYR